MNKYTFQRARGPNRENTTVSVGIWTITDCEHSDSGVSKVYSGLRAGGLFNTNYDGVPRLIRRLNDDDAECRVVCSVDDDEESRIG